MDSDKLRFQAGSFSDQFFTCLSTHSHTPCHPSSQHAGTQQRAEVRGLHAQGASSLEALPSASHSGFPSLRFSIIKVLYCTNHTLIPQYNASSADRNPDRVSVLSGVTQLLETETRASLAFLLPSLGSDLLHRDKPPLPSLAAPWDLRGMANVVAPFFCREDRPALLWPTLGTIEP